LGVVEPVVRLHRGKQGFNKTGKKGRRRNCVENVYGGRSKTGPAGVLGAKDTNNDPAKQVDRGGGKKRIMGIVPRPWKSGGSE